MTQVRLRQSLEERKIQQFPQFDWCISPVTDGLLVSVCVFIYMLCRDKLNHMS